ncbi:hypothetical protein D3C85_1745890 [compost metagenome]
MISAKASVWQRVMKLLTVPTSRLQLAPLLIGQAQAAIVLKHGQLLLNTMQTTCMQLFSTLKPQT